jgi:hypothetical protein
MKTTLARVHFRWPAAPAFVIALLAAGDFVLGARISQAQVLWGSSSKGGSNTSSVFTIDRTTGLATLVGASGLGDGVSGIRFDPQSGTMYGILGSTCTGARLITIDTATGAGTVVGTLAGAGFDGGTGVFCGGGSDAIAFAPDGTLYAGGYSLGATSLLRLDKTTGAVLEAHPTPGHLAGMAFDPSGALWASHGNSSFSFELHTIDPSTGGETSTLTLSEPVIVSDLAFAADGTLYASLPSENNLATVDTASGLVTRIGSFGPAAGRISGLAMTSPVSQLTALGPALLWVGLKDGDDSTKAFDLRVDFAVNGEPLTSGVARCVTGLSRNPSAVPVAFDSFPALTVKPGDVFSLKVWNRMGTSADDTKCKDPGATNTSAVGLRLSYDSADHASRVDATITTNPGVSFFLHSDGGACTTSGPASAGVTTLFLDESAPTAASDKCRDSASGNPGGVNAWKEIGTWNPDAAALAASPKGRGR